MSLRRAARLLPVVLAWLPGPAAAEVSFIPLPAFDTDPNSGQTYGVLPVLLFRDHTDVVKAIVAPSVTFNEVRGWTGTFRYFAYPRALERFEFLAGYSEKIERELDIHYRNLDLLGGRFHADVQALHERDAAIRFFGLGPESKAENETNMTLEVTGLYAIVGVNLTPTSRLSLAETIQRFEVRRGGVTALPFTGDVFPDLPGLQGATVHAQRLALAYDSRDSLTVPTRGLAVTLFAEASAEALGSASDYIKSGVEAVYLRPLGAGRITVVARGLVEALSADSDTPFQVRPRLGGDSTLRGYGENRFFGDARVLVNLESRVRVFKLRLFGVNAEFEVAPFIDAGKVFNNTAQLTAGGIEVTPGIGFRGLTPPSVVGHIEVGVSREGPAIFVGLDYPF